MTLTTFQQAAKRIPPRGDCWNWPLSVAPNGYGKVRMRNPRRNASAHRVAYEAFRGPIETGLVIDHLCRNRKCVNPWHMESVTQRENIMRGQAITAKNARKTHCLKGHPFTKENTYLAKAGRNCRTCSNEFQRGYDAKKKGETIIKKFREYKNI